MTDPDRRLSVAPMMDWTDSLDRRFLRLITRRTLLYTEMVTAQALKHGNPETLLAFDPTEAPLALQLGGGEPALLAEAVRIAAGRGFAEVNLNVGCPSDRVSAGRFGACLMTEPNLVAACVAAMAEASDLPVTVKHRIGVDDADSYADLVRFVETVAAAGCRTFVVHARKAWLSGLSPKENREVPPLRHDVVHRLKVDFPDLEIVVNGGIRDLDAAAAHLGPTDGVMIGRAAYETPWILAAADRRIFGDPRLPPTRREVVEGLAELAARVVAEGVPLARLTRHALGLFHGCPGAKTWRRMLGEDARLPEWNGPRAAELVRLAAARVPADRLDERPAA
ncbi:tRNA-dihydrouridine synthase A [uncultured Alphaproteobacteria bacterium]|uniref:tRNA-dihydrouridine(20/20a) synthase n=1 Tax=uncultured Alphaproteobacteria bacterium TaxID=91750 RepID=A0A212JA95_9PROT|nr:tRNA-dihydrouridine synthase A [uncultured Alphaproteobacteria bacterium]